MVVFRGDLIGATLLLLLAGPAPGQDLGQLPAPNTTAVAATVNGQPIPEETLRRALQRVPRERQAEARSGILQYLVDNIVIDQYLQKAGVAVTDQELEAKLEEIRADIKKEKQSFEKVLQNLGVDERELRGQLLAELRWDKFLTGQANEKVLVEVFQKNPEMFNGSMVRARHVLLTPASADAQAADQAKQKLQLFKKQVEEQAVKVVANLPPGTDELIRQKTAARAREEVFADLAKKESACPSRDQGGDVGWFPRTGGMVEPFARTAFALKPFEVSDVVQTQFGCHLILVTDRKPGRETKYEDVKDLVREVYGQKLREAMLAQLRPQSKIVINQQPGT